MSLTIACPTEPLAPFVPRVDLPWDAAAAQHLHRRLGYGLSPAGIAGALAQNPTAHVRGRLAAAAAVSPLARPTWWDWTASDYTDPAEAAAQVIAWRSATVARMRADPWRGKMELFWLNHFVTQIDSYGCPSYLWNYHDVVQAHAFGDFRAFVRAIGRTPAMLVYLDGVRNSRIQPNENYARELFELFTLGRDRGYTQADIVAAARALTGFNGFTEACAPITYLAFAHDPGLKTIFGRTAAFDYDGLVDLIFDARAVECSEYICGRLYGHFVSPELDPGVVAALATTFRDSGWQLGAVYEELFASAHFFSANLRGTRIKDPFELVLQEETELGSRALGTAEYLTATWFFAGNLGQMLFEPPDVAGWPGDRDWVNATRLAVRKESTRQVLFLSYTEDRPRMATWARSLMRGGSETAEAVTRAIVDFVLPQGLPRASDYDRAVKQFKGEVPSYYFDTGIWSLDFEYAPDQVALLLDYLFARPEYQLC